MLQFALSVPLLGDGIGVDGLLRGGVRLVKVCPDDLKVWDGGDAVQNNTTRKNEKNTKVNS